MTEVQVLQVLHTFKGTQTELSSLLISVRWSGDIMQAARKLEVELNNTIYGKVRAISIQEGAEITFIYRGTTLFRGVLFSDRINHKGNHVFTAYDENTYLVRNTDTVKVLNQTASTVIRQLCGKFGIATGTIQDTGYVIPRMILRDMNLWEMFVTMLTTTRKMNGRTFAISCENGLLCVRERKTNTVQWVLENEVNLLSAEYSRSIEDTRTQVKVMGEDKYKKEVSTVVSNGAMKALYGTMQHLENVSAETTQDAVNTRAKELLAQLATIDDDAEVEALGKPDVIAGKAVYVKESMTGIIGSYYVSTDAHDFRGNFHVMKVTLSATDELPMMEYNPSNDEEEQK